MNRIGSLRSAAPDTDWKPASAVPPSPESATAITSRPTRLYCIFTPASMVAVLVSSEWKIGTLAPVCPL